MVVSFALDFVQACDQKVTAFDRLLCEGLCAPILPGARQFIAFERHDVLTNERADCYHVKSLLSAIDRASTDDGLRVNSPALWSCIEWRRRRNLLRDQRRTVKRRASPTARGRSFRCCCLCTCSRWRWRFWPTTTARSWIRSRA